MGYSINDFLRLIKEQKAKERKDNYRKFVDKKTKKKGVSRICQ